MNSVMDDNKLLTLPNSERIRVADHCKLLFEVYDLQYASPATISRCGLRSSLLYTVEPPDITDNNQTLLGLIGEFIDCRR